MIRINEETDDINLFESKLCGFNFSEDFNLTIIIDWIGGWIDDNGDDDSEKITFLGKSCTKVICYIETLTLDDLDYDSHYVITGFSYKKLEHGYLVHFNFNLEGYLRFECREFSIEAEGSPLEPGGNDNFYY